MAERTAEVEALRQERKERPSLPVGGETGPMAARSYRRLQVRVTGPPPEVLAGAYPFFAAEGLGPAACSSTRTPGPARQSISSRVSDSVVSIEWVDRDEHNGDVAKRRVTVALDEATLRVLDAEPFYSGQSRSVLINQTHAREIADLARRSDRARTR